MIFKNLMNFEFHEIRNLYFWPQENWPENRKSENNKLKANKPDSAGENEDSDRMTVVHSHFEFRLKFMQNVCLPVTWNLATKNNGRCFGNKDELNKNY